MAINERGSNQQGQEDVRTAEQRQSTTTTAPETSSTRGTGLRSLNRVLTRSIGRNAGSEQVIIMRRLMEEIIAEKGIDPSMFKLVTVDQNMFSVAYPTLAVVMEEELAGRVVTNAFVFAMCGGQGELPKREFQIAGETLYMPRTWVDNITVNYRNEVRNAVNHALGLDGLSASTIVGVTVVPNLLDQNSSHIALSCLAAAENACSTRFAMDFGKQLGIPVFDMGWMSTSDQPTSNLQFNPSSVQDTDIIGNPVRSDISISLTNRIRNPQNDYETQQRLIASTGFIDLTYTPPQVSATMGFGQPQQSTVCYQPRFIFTSMYPEDIEAFTPELLALGVGNAVATLNTGNTWMYDFVAKARQKGSMHNPGGLAMELDESIVEPLDLSGRDDKEIFAFMNTVVHPTLVYSIDIPEEGEYSWLFGMLAKAAQIYETTSDDSSRVVFTRGYNELYEAWDRATLGQFSRQYEKGSPIVVPAQNRIALGYYVGSDNIKHDIRDVDTLYQLNQNSNNMNAVIEWEDTFDRVEVDVNKRTLTRHEILTAMFGGSWVQTSWAVRYDFHPQCIQALIRAIAACNFKIRPENIRACTGTTTRGNSNIQAMALNGIDNAIYAQSSAGNNGGRTNIDDKFNLF